jgi:hypothetical protein
MSPNGAPARPIAALAGARILYWSPVFVALALFAQVALRGLRPAVSEHRRLAAAEAVLEARRARDQALGERIALELRAREDPIFRERQRRLRRAAPETP